MTSTCQVIRCHTEIEDHQLTCPGCIARARDDMRRIEIAAALMLPEAVHRGVDSEAANLAGPAPHPAVAHARFAERRAELMAEHLPHDFAGYNAAYDAELAILDIEVHPYGLLGRWEMMIREDYDLPETEPITVSGSVAFLGRVLHRVAQDPEQDFALLAGDLHRCRAHCEAVLRANAQVEAGAPCHLCDGGTFLKRYAEARTGDGKRDRAGYLLDTEGHRIPDDYWQCSGCRAELSDPAYRRVVTTSYVLTAEVLPIADLVARTGIPASTLRRWASGWQKAGEWQPALIKAVGTTRGGMQTYRVADVEATRRSLDAGETKCGDVV